MGRGELLTICHFWYYSHHAWVSPRLATLCCWEIWVDGLLIDCQLSNLTRSRAWAMRVYYEYGVSCDSIIASPQPWDVRYVLGVIQNNYPVPDELCSFNSRYNMVCVESPHRTICSLLGHAFWLFSSIVREIVLECLGKFPHSFGMMSQLCIRSKLLGGHMKWVNPSVYKLLSWLRLRSILFL